MPVRITDDVPAAVAALRSGGLVAFPTETVYGLGASIMVPSAVARVFAVKGRPADHPLIVHIADLESLRRWSRSPPGYAERLGAAFWPGPLTLVVNRSSRVGDFVTGGQETVGIRVPDHAMALAILRGLGDGVAAPSANRFGRVSPTLATHVSRELGALLDPKRDLIMDGGPTAVGVESTIVDCTGPAPRLLRPGAVTASDIEAATGLRLAPADPAVRAPGTLAAHYAPTASVLIVGGPGPPCEGGPAVGLIAPATVATPQGVVRLLAPHDVAAYAAGLYAALRQADELGLSEVRVVLPSGDGLPEAVRDRVQRAAAGSP